MWNRRPPSKKETLLTAVLFTAGTLMWVYMAIQANMNAENYTSLTLTSTAAIVVIGALISGMFWHRYFTMDKKR